MEKQKSNEIKITIKYIRQNAQKPKSQESWLAWYFFRHLSPYLTWLLARTPVTPNAVTWTMLIVGIAGGILLATPSYTLAFLGIFAYHLLYLLDCVDGELARSKKKFSPVGEPLDHIVHYITETALLMGAGIGLYLRSNLIFILIAMAVLVLSNLFHHTAVDTILQFYPVANEKSNQSQPLGTIKRWLGFFSRMESVYVFMLLTLGFDLFFHPFPHPWGVTTFYYFGLAVVFLVKVFPRIKHFYRKVSSASQEKQNS